MDFLHIYKHLLVAPIVLSLTLIGSVNAFASGEPSNLLDLGNLTLPKDHVITPQALLLDNDVTFPGEGTSYFNYNGTADLRFYIKNTGNKRIHVELNFPGGSRNLMRITLAPGESTTNNFPLYDVYGPSANGQYSVYVYNDDGSRGSYHISARTLE
jgi:hypothetical protein